MTSALVTVRDEAGAVVGKPVTSSDQGEYWKLLLPEKYTVTRRRIRMMSMSMICSGQWNLLPVLHCRLCAGERGGGGDPQRGGAPGPGQHRAGHCDKQVRGHRTQMRRSCDIAMVLHSVVFKFKIYIVLSEL